MTISTAFLTLEIIAIVILLVMCMLIYALSQNTLVLKQLIEKLAHSIKEEDNEQFNGEQAEQWFEKGDLDTLNRYCEAFIKEAPNSVHANWYYALSHYNQGEYDIARQYFENVIAINPLWRDGAAVYLQEIAEKVGMPQTHVVH